jgi:hypothetical protein
MNTFLQNLLLGVTRPKKLYSILAGKPYLNHAISIALAMGGVHALELINDHNMSAFLQKLKNPSLLVMLVYAIIAGLLYFLVTVFHVFLNVVCVKIVFYILHIKSSIKTLLTVLTFTLVPLLIRDVIGALWTGYDGALGFGGPYEIYYYKTSLAQLVANSNFTNQIMFYVLSQFEIFAIWSFILGVVAVAVVGKVSYKLSSFVMLFYWIISSSLYLLATVEPLGGTWGTLGGTLGR